MGRTRIAIASVFIAGAVMRGDAQRTSAPITPSDARTRLRIIADDSMRGRLAGDIGNVRATDYIARELKRLGLAPAGENGTYFQTVPVESMSIDSTAGLFAGGIDLRAGRDFTVAIRSAAGRRFALDSARVTYGGSLGDTMTMISPAQARGRVVILGPHVVNGTRQYLARAGAGLGTRFTGAAAIFYAQLDTIPPNAAEFDANLSLANADTSRARLGGTITVAAAERLFGRSLGALVPGDTGVVVRSTVQIHKTPPPYATRNVLAVWRGTDPALANEYVFIGAHSDHVGVARHAVDHDSVWAYNRVFRPMGLASLEPLPATAERGAVFRRSLDSLRRVHKPRPDSISNGSDDDGSGSAALLEIAESIASRRVRPKRSVVFAWFNAEEAGLLGSRYFVEHPTLPRDAIVAELQMDQISRGGADDVHGGGPRLLYVVSARDRSSALWRTITEINGIQRRPFVLDLAYDAQGQPDQVFCRSDHWEFERRGIPVALFFTGVHPDYHQVTDEPQYGDYGKLARVAQLVRDVALRLANGTTRPPLDRPVRRPEPGCG